MDGEALLQLPVWRSSGASRGRGLGLFLWGRFRLAAAGIVEPIWPFRPLYSAAWPRQEQLAMRSIKVAAGIWACRPARPAERARYSPWIGARSLHHRQRSCARRRWL